MSDPQVPPPEPYDPPAQSPTQPEPGAQLILNDEDLGSMVDIKEAKVERAFAAFQAAKAELEAEQAGLAALKGVREHVVAGGHVMMTLHL